MFMLFLQGFMLSGAMIIPLGPQNVFVMNQGILRQHHLLVALLCAMSDMALILTGVLAGGVLLAEMPLLLQVITWGGVLFLLWYGWGALRIALRRLSEEDIQVQALRSRKAIILTLLAVTWLNPHVYLDTVVILGSLAGQLPADQRYWFALGAVSASWLWFFSLALLAAGLAPWLKTPRVQRAIHLFIAVVMWSIAFNLAQHAFAY